MRSARRGDGSDQLGGHRVEMHERSLGARDDHGAFACGDEQGDEIVAAARAEIASLQGGGADS